MDQRELQHETVRAAPDLGMTEYVTWNSSQEKGRCSSPAEMAQRQNLHEAMRRRPDAADLGKA